MPSVRGRIFDAETGHPMAARVHVVDSTGEYKSPAAAIQKVGGGPPFFYADGEFEVDDLFCGQFDVIVERGIEYQTLQVAREAPRNGTVDLELPLHRWINLPREGWFAGNTHVHYNEHETRAEERIRLDPRVEDLPVTIASIAQRWNLDYASNHFPIGRRPEFSSPGHVVDVGEETRHDNWDGWSGFGHIMLINIKQRVEPVSRGYLVDESSPDYPPLVDACDTARSQGGVVLWCHNGKGMEAPVAAALGKLDGFNLFDPYWMDPEYDVWYALLNCGFHLPASTGSDWFICSSNRVYVDLGDQDFTYDAWLARLRAGRTFITNGPALFLSVEGHSPDNEVALVGTNLRSLRAEVRWRSQIPVDRVELIQDGHVVATVEPNGTDEGKAGVFQHRVTTDTASWVAARCWGRRRTSYGQFLWAHTSPVYLRHRSMHPHLRQSATFFVERLASARKWLGETAHLDRPQRERLLQLYGDADTVFRRLAE